MTTKRTKASSDEPDLVSPPTEGVEFSSDGDTDYDDLLNFDDNNSQHANNKRSRDAPSERSSPQKKRTEVLRERRKTVLGLYQEHAQQSHASDKILAKLSGLYQKHILPLEQSYKMHSFCLPTSSPVTHAELMAKPMVLLMGPYSTGKTTFICHLLGGLFPGVHIGPEPTTDKFMAICHGTKDGVSYKDPDNELGDDSHGDYFRSESDFEDIHEKHELEGKIVKGNTLTVTPELPFSSLEVFGSAFLNHFDGSICNSPLLRNLTLIDTPGVLSGKQQRENRSYDFSATSQWFANRCDLILLLFDAHKLDISDEFKAVFNKIRPHNDDKIRCILNKADQISREQLVRVYGSLMWSMGKLFETPEVVRVYTGSYWDEPLQHDDFAGMFESDEWLLIHELMNLPSVSAERKVNAMVKRIRMVKVHACILGYLSANTPRYYGAGVQRRYLLDNLQKQVFDKVIKLHQLSPGDMPPVKEFKAALELYPDWSVFPAIRSSEIQQLDDLISTEIPGIIKQSPSKAKQARAQKKSDEKEKKALAETKKSVVSTKMILMGLGALLGCILFGLVMHFVFLPTLLEESPPTTGVESLDGMLGNLVKPAAVATNQQHLEQIATEQRQAARKADAEKQRKAAEQKRAAEKQAQRKADAEQQRRDAEQHSAEHPSERERHTAEHPSEQEL